MEILRTPDDRFSDLPGYEFAPHYVNIPSGDVGVNLRVHYIDEGPSGSRETVLLMHGEPSWCFLYRKMVPTFVANGFRVIAPDLIGFGRSDKPVNRDDYTYERHVGWMQSTLDHLELENLTLVCQDWGGLIGLRLVAANPDRFRRVVVANTYLPTGDHHVSDAFFSWQRFSQEVPSMPIGQIINAGTVTELAPEVIAAYDAPFPDETYKEGARQFPMLVPTTPDDPSSEANRKAWEVLKSFENPFLCAFSDLDPITKGGDKPFRELVPGAKIQKHVTIEGASHFLQEDRGEELAEVVTVFIHST